MLISIPTLLKSPYLCLVSRPRKLPRFGPNVSPSANDPVLPSRSSVSRSAARRLPPLGGDVNRFLIPIKRLSACAGPRAYQGIDGDQSSPGDFDPHFGLGRKIYRCYPIGGRQRILRRCESTSNKHDAIRPIWPLSKQHGVGYVRISAKANSTSEAMFAGVCTHRSLGLCGQSPRDGRRASVEYRLPTHNAGSTGLQTASSIKSL